ncbi:MAG: GDP-mannose 4,6-dehydratase [Opitutae bacterium]|nr:GDP-mannose 4,6-dehydratase [Opitutae bacterium]
MKFGRDSSSTPSNRRALICGISGQDGAYLAELLLAKGYTVYGTSRDAMMSGFGHLARLGLRDRVHLRSLAITDFRSVMQAFLDIEPDEIYNLAGQSSVGLSFEQPAETLESMAFGTLNLLEALRMLKSSARLYNAGSGECFGECPERPADERSPFRPRSPYGVAKAASFWEVVNYREAYGLFACSGLLFNHESPLRPARFVTRKIIQAAGQIAAGRKEKLQLGNISIQRDWGWAPEYVDAMWRMLQQPVADDFVIATGASYSLQDFVAQAFAHFNLDWRDHVTTDKSLYRPSDIAVSRGNPAKAKDQLGWSAQTHMPEVVRRMIAAEPAAGAQPGA